jgi:hypothetical protein
MNEAEKWKKMNIHLIRKKLRRELRERRYNTKWHHQVWTISSCDGERE